MLRKFTNSARILRCIVDAFEAHFFPGTVLVELAVRLLSHNEKAVSEALEKFNDNPTGMTDSVRNIKTFLACLAEDETHFDVQPLDIFRLL